MKFRVWDKEFKEMLGGAEYMLTAEGRLYCNYDIGKIRAFPEGTYVVQFFTSLKDKNGKDVYEGDILKFADLNYVVSWAEWKWIASCPNYNRHHWPTFEHFSQARISEVVGNIFENPELLK